MSASEDERRARLAAALKQNISRRKAQSRAREASLPGTDEPGADPTGKGAATPSSDPKAHKAS
jgi:hypothetical protein